MVEAMVALVLVDQLLQQYAQCQILPTDPVLQVPAVNFNAESSPL